jgi:hypothetical protein
MITTLLIILLGIGLFFTDDEFLWGLGVFFILMLSWTIPIAIITPEEVVLDSSYEVLSSYRTTESEVCVEFNPDDATYFFTIKGENGVAEDVFIPIKDLVITQDTTATKPMFYFYEGRRAKEFSWLWSYRGDCWAKHYNVVVPSYDMIERRNF